MEYDIIVKPGGDPNNVKLSYEGIEDLKVTDNGDLQIALKQGSIIQKKPIIYQEIDGEKVVVDGGFKIQDSRLATLDSQPTTQDSRQFSYTFELASYNKSHDLIIDPVIVWSTYLRGSGDDGGYSWPIARQGIAVDTSGNAYVTGGTASADFPIISSINGTSAGASWVTFITKINSKGDSLVYSTYMEGSGGNSIAVDTSGNVYITTVVSGRGVYDDWGDAFVVKIGEGTTTDYLNQTTTDINNAAFTGSGKQQNALLDKINTALSAMESDPADTSIAISAMKDFYKVLCNMKKQGKVDTDTYNTLYNDYSNIMKSLGETPKSKC